MDAGRQRSRGWPLPPRWAYDIFHALHRAGYDLSGGRLGLRTGADDRMGTLRLTTIGCRSGEKRSAMLYYLPDGDRFAVVASNAGSGHAPAWFLNLRSQPEAMVDVPGRSLRVHARIAEGDERADLWLRVVARRDIYRRYAEVAGREIPVVVLQPIEAGADG